MVQARLELDWRLQQIAALLRLASPVRSDWYVCHQSIYQALSHLRVHTLADRRAVEARLNHRPRRVLGWRTPTEVFESWVAR